MGYSASMGPGFVRRERRPMVRALLLKRFSGFNGARLCSPGKTLATTEKRKGADGASMGPGFVRRERRKEAGPHRADDSPLQWGPALFAGKDLRRKSC